MREQRQKQFAEEFCSSNLKGLLILAARSGKTYVTVHILNKLYINKICILYPTVDIQDGWEDTFAKTGYLGQIRYCTFRSLHKVVLEEGEALILDEAHMLSAKNIKDCERLVDSAKVVVGLTGTATQKTRKELFYGLGLSVISEYTIEQAVSEGLLADYHITIHKVPLDNTYPYIHTKRCNITEKRAFQNLVYTIEKKPIVRKFMELKQINLLQNSISRRDYTKELITEFKDERVLIFCGVTSIADSLGIPVYHSKNQDKEILDNFCNNKGINKLACCAMLNAGITIFPIDRSILSYQNGSPEQATQRICRILGKEIWNPEKYAQIDYIVSTELMEEIRLKTALSFMNPNKISIYES